MSDLVAADGRKLAEVDDSVTIDVGRHDEPLAVIKGEIRAKCRSQSYLELLGVECSRPVRVTVMRITQQAEQEASGGDALTTRER